MKIVCLYLVFFPLCSLLTCLFLKCVFVCVCVCVCLCVCVCVCVCVCACVWRYLQEKLSFDREGDESDGFMIPNFFETPLRNHVVYVTMSLSIQAKTVTLLVSRSGLFYTKLSPGRHHASSLTRFRWTLHLVTLITRCVTCGLISLCVAVSSAEKLKEKAWYSSDNSLYCNRQAVLWMPEPDTRQCARVWKPAWWLILF